MPVNASLASDIWLRYQFVRDNGHLDYVHKAKRCEDFFTGLQWDANDLALLRQQRRPALTINKIISTLSTVMGEQIYNRSQVAFRPRNEGSSQEIADVLMFALLLADRLDIDVGQAITDKLAANELKYPVALARSNARKYTELREP